MGNVSAPDSILKKKSSALLKISRPHHIVIVGGSYAGVSAALSLLALKDGQPLPFASYGDYSHLKEVPRVQNLKVTIIDQRDGFFHTVGAPLAHISSPHAQQMWKQYDSLSRLNRSDVSCIQGSVTNIDVNNQTLQFKDNEDQMQSQDYDYLLVSTGIRRKFPIVPRAYNLCSYVNEASDYAQMIKNAGTKGVAVIGGGAVGIEFAGKIKALYPDTPVTLIHSRNELLSNEPLPKQFKARALHILEEEGVRVILNKRAMIEDLPDGSYYVKFQDGDRIHTGLVITSISHTTGSAIFFPKEFISSQGFVKVDPQLRLTADLCKNCRIYAAGDIAEWQGIKLGGSAMVMGSVAAANIYSSVLSEEDSSRPLIMETCPTMEPKMALSIGTNAVCYGGGDTEIQYGKELSKLFFGNDMGWEKVLTALGLGGVELEK